jgi:hypothetical protein
VAPSTAGNRCGYRVQSVDVNVQSVEANVQSVDVNVQSVDWRKVQSVEEAKVQSVDSELFSMTVSLWECGVYEG